MLIQPCKSVLCSTFNKRQKWPNGDPCTHLHIGTRTFKIKINIFGNLIEQIFNREGALSFMKRVFWERLLFTLDRIQKRKSLNFCFTRTFLSKLNDAHGQLLSLAVWSKCLGKFGNIWKRHLAEDGPRPLDRPRPLAWGIHLG